MKVTFHVKSKELGISFTKSIDVSYHEIGHICSLILYGKLEKLGVVLISGNSVELPVAQYLFVLDINWSKFRGFEFKQYLDQSLSSSLPKKFGFLRSYTQIQIARNLICVSFRAEVNREDLGKSDERLFLENSNRYGITVKNIDFYDVPFLSGLNLSNCHFVDVSFSTCRLDGVIFSGGRFSNVKFISSNLNGSDFQKAILTNVIFESSLMSGCNFQECVVKYGARRIWDETILKIHDCNLQGANFKQSEVCLVAEDSNLSEVNFSQSKLTACRFYNCTLDQMNFTGSKFTSSPEAIKLRDQYSDIEKFVCKFGSRNLSLDLSGKKKNLALLSLWLKWYRELKNYNSATAEKLALCFISLIYYLMHSRAKISNSYFVSALMEGIDFSHNDIVNCIFEDADLRNAKLNHCLIEDCKFQRVTLNSARCSFVNLSFSLLNRNNFNEVDFYRAVMISVEDEGSKFAASNLSRANLRDGKFFKSVLTGVFFGEANLTLATFDKCKLNGANFYQTQRSGIDLNIKDETGKKITNAADLQNLNDSNSNSKSLPKLKSTCEIGSVQWYSNSNGEILIDENTFLHIVIGNKSPIAVLANLTKENPNIINIMNQNDLRTAGRDQVNADTNVDSVSNGSVKGSDIQIGDVIGNNEVGDDDILDISEEPIIPHDIESNESEEDALID